MKWLDRDTVRLPHIALCFSEKDYKKAAKHCKLKDPCLWLDEDTQKAQVHTWERKGAITCVVCVSPDVWKAKDQIDVACTLVHEAVHIFQRLCDNIGEEKPSREFEAYSIERISEVLMRELVRRKGKK